MNALYKNPGHGNKWLSVKLVGVESNRAAIGALVKVTVEDADGTTRSVYSSVDNGSSFGGSTLTREIGLGQAQGILSLEVYWRATGIRQTFSDVPMDRHIRVREGAEDYEMLDLPPVPLGVGR